MTWGTNELRLAFEIFYGIATIGAWLYAWQVQRRSAAKAEISRIERTFVEKTEEASSRVDRIETRLAVVERDVSTLPDHKELGQLYDRLNSLHGDLQQLTGTVTSLTRQLTLINEHLLNGSSR